MKKRVTALLLSLGLMSTQTVSAVGNDVSAVTPQIAKAYLDIVKQQTSVYGGTAVENTNIWGEVSYTGGFAGGLVRDFDQNGTPELYLIGSKEGNVTDQIWTWDGNKAKKLAENSCGDNLASWFKETTLHIVNGKTYYHTLTFGSHMFLVDCGAGGIYTVEGTKWKEILSYNYNIYDEYDPYGNEDEFYTTVNGKKVEYSSKAALMREIAKYQSDSCVLLAGDVGLSFVNWMDLKAELEKSASNQPSSWAKAEVDAAKAAGLVPALTGNPGYQTSITRQQFAELVVTLVEKAVGHSLEAAPAGTFSDCTNLAVRKASAAGIVNGMGDGLFAPNQTTNREQIATMVNRAIQYIKAETGTDLTPMKGSISKFADKSSVSSWAVEGVGALAANGIMNGTSSTQLSPKATCTVEQSILLSFRTFEKMP